MVEMCPNGNTPRCENMPLFKHKKMVGFEFFPPTIESLGPARTLDGYT